MTDTIAIETNVQIPTWFGCGGAARRFARPRTTDELKAAVGVDPNLRVLGDGANLLVADEGVDELVVSLAAGEFADVKIDAATGVVRVGAGVNLPKLLTETARLGLAGLETLGGIPATVGGAIVMNAGAFGQTADTLTWIHAVRRNGEAVTLKRPQVEFTYRHTSLGDLIVTGADFKLRPADPAKVRDKLKEVMAYKKKTQPLADHSAGCCFKNPTLAEGIRDVGTVGTRVSAGLLIDRAGCKGLKHGGASVSEQHANFVVAAKGCTAGDILTLMHAVRAKVHATFGLTLEPEIAIWGATL